MDRHEGRVMFHFNGLPVTAAEVAAVLRHRLDWRRVQLKRQREKDAREGTMLRQLWSMIRGRDA